MAGTRLKKRKHERYPIVRVTVTGNKSVVETPVTWRALVLEDMNLLA